MVKSKEVLEAEIQAYRNIHNKQMYVSLASASCLFAAPLVDMPEAKLHNMGLAILGIGMGINLGMLGLGIYVSRKEKQALKAYESRYEPYLKI